jgi:hypothetical protein
MEEANPLETLQNLFRVGPHGKTRHRFLHVASYSQFNMHSLPAKSVSTWRLCCLWRVIPQLTTYQQTLTKQKPKQRPKRDLRSCAIATTHNTKNKNNPNRQQPTHQLALGFHFWMQPETVPDYKTVPAGVFCLAVDVYRDHYTSTSNTKTKNKADKYRTNNRKAPNYFFNNHNGDAIFTLKS